MKRIDPDDLIDMSPMDEAGLVRIELAYARDDNLLFEERVYREDAQLYVHKDLACIVENAAKAAFNAGYRFVLYDGLRTIDAQEKMLNTQRVKDNPHWLEEPRLLSPPGAGAHPRAMAIDCSLETLDGQLLDMGTAFDYLAEDSAPVHNAAHRKHPDLESSVKANRALLDGFMLNAAESAGIEIFPLPQEWWDFRLPSEVYEHFHPLCDADLPASKRLISAQ